MYNLLAARKNKLSGDQLDNSGPLQTGAPKLIARFPGSFKEMSLGSKARHDQRLQVQGGASSHQDDGGRRSSKDHPVVLGSGSKGEKIHFSGPLLAQLHNTDQMMKDHDRQIQEAVRRSHLDKARMRKIRVEDV